MGRAFGYIIAAHPHQDAMHAYVVSSKHVVIYIFLHFILPQQRKNENGVK